LGFTKEFGGINMHNITMLGTGLIGRSYTMALHRQRGADRVHTVFSPTEEHVSSFAEEFDIPNWTTDMAEAVHDPETDVVVVGLPNHVHKEAVLMAADTGKAVLCTKPLGRNAAEAWDILEAVEDAGVFHGYLENMVHAPKILNALQFVKHGAVGRVLWVRSRETHGGPHGAWFWDMEKAGGGVIVDMGCHCIEIARSFVGKGNRPLEVMCWADTLVHPITGEDHGIGLIRFESGAIGQFEVSWAFRGGMDLRDEVSGTEGTIRVDHFLRTGFEVFTAAGRGGYVSEKAEGETGWLFPVGDEVHELGHPDMFKDMLDALDSGQEPAETFYDGYVVNAIIDACYRSAGSKRWEPVELEEWRGVAEPAEEAPPEEYRDSYVIIKQEHMPDGKTKLILRDKGTDEITEMIVSE
jgi:predicted dehydrogenase